ncbi:exosortase K [Flaviramulus sp. BrNp1-15]|uniref:exosortase K n=1 Tax=Flaviramulus sp. BrNp1-15 TaxID=2916754 RepID=UPI001EE97834|nr:exosortase K [Flaviramulus sp. BrNp1-15]ULC59018.1 exosortase K [Flaviramulus sp. BrNp1-15]
MKTKNTIYYIIVLSLIVFGKTAHIYATNNSLIFILKPLSNIVSFITDTDFIYSNTNGFYFEVLNITIDKSCSGINFWLISFVVFINLLLNICKSTFQKTILFPLILLMTFILTLFANTSRILISIFIEKQTKFNYSWLHQAEGVFIYLFFLILTYTIINHLLSKYNIYDEKLT